MEMCDLTLPFYEDAALLFMAGLLGYFLRWLSE